MSEKTDNLVFVLGGGCGGASKDEMEAIVQHLKKENISFVSLPTGILSGLREYTDEDVSKCLNNVIKDGKTPVLVEVEHNVNLPKGVQEIKQKDGSGFSYGPESAIAQVLEVAGAEMDMDLLYEAAFTDTQARLHLDAELPIHQEKYPLDNGLKLVLERTISDTVDFPWGIDGELLKDMSKIPTTNTKYKAYMSGFIQDKNGKKIELFPNEEDRERGTYLFIVSVEDNKVSKLGVNNGDIVCAASIAIANKGEHTIIDEKQKTKSKNRNTSSTYTETTSIDGLLASKTSFHGREKTVNCYEKGELYCSFRYNDDRLCAIQVMKDGKIHKEGFFDERGMYGVKCYTYGEQGCDITYRKYDKNVIEQEKVYKQASGDELRFTWPDKYKSAETYVFEQGQLKTGFNGNTTIDSPEMDKHSVQFIKKKIEKMPSASDEEKYFSKFINMTKTNQLTNNNQRE